MINCGISHTTVFAILRKLEEKVVFCCTDKFGDKLINSVLISGTDKTGRITVILIKFWQ